MRDSDHDPGITRLLAAWHQGQAQALDQIVDRTYDLLRRLASGMMASERGGHTLQPTEVVHEAWQRLAASDEPPALKDRQHFYNIAARVMRRVLVDHARRRAAERRGGAVVRTELTVTIAVADDDRIEMLALDEALKRLEEVDPRRARVVELHCFAGLTLDETAGVLRIAQATVCRDWRLARAFLRSALSDGRCADTR
jgi:RNA polymerase sigma factor (TIGR02999 family)